MSKPGLIEVRALNGKSVVRVPIVHVDAEGHHYAFAEDVRSLAKANAPSIQWRENPKTGQPARVLTDRLGRMIELKPALYAFPGDEEKLKRRGIELGEQAKDDDSPREYGPLEVKVTYFDSFGKPMHGRTFPTLGHAGNGAAAKPRRRARSKQPRRR